MVTQLELTISCRNLHDADEFSKSDPMVVVEQLVREIMFSFMSSEREKFYFYVLLVGPLVLTQSYALFYV